jgi:hypothetical protein
MGDITSEIRRQVRAEVDRRMGETQKRASRTERQVDGRVALLLRRLAILEALALSFRRTSVQLPALAPGANEIAVEWEVPFAVADYSAAPALESGPVILGRLTAGIKADSRTRTGCTVVVTNSAQVNIPAGVTLNVLAWRSIGGE